VHRNRRLHCRVNVVDNAIDDRERTAVSGRRDRRPLFRMPMTPGLVRAALAA